MKADKLHTTNYFNTFIQVAEDCKATCGTPPPSKGDRKTVAELQFELISKNAYRFTSDDILFRVYAVRNKVTPAASRKAREQFFSKGQPCLRSSPLAKTYGFGFHFDKAGRVALYGVETDEYRKLAADPKIKTIKAMKTSKKKAGFG